MPTSFLRVEAIGETISNFRIHHTSPATRIDLTFDCCKVVLRRAARNARRRCTPILSVTFDIYRFEDRERGGEEDCYVDYNRDAIDSDISCSRSKTLGFVFPCPFHSKRISYPVERKIENEMPREEWKLNTEVDIRGSSFSVSLRIGAIYVIVV